MLKKALSLFLLFLFFATTLPVHAEEQSLRNRIKIRKRINLPKVALEESEELTIEKQALLAKKRSSLILDIKKFLREARGDDQKAELNLRLGQLFMEDYYFGLAKAQAQLEAETAKFNSLKNKSATAPKLDNTEALASLDRARGIYTDLASRFTTHPRRHEMLYFLSIASMDRGLTREAMEALKELVDHYPKSKYQNDALVQLGDHFFEQNQFQLAEPYFDKIVQRKHKPLLSYAIYKKAWCAYNTQRPQPALDQFKWVIANEEQNELKGGQIRVKNEALRDITLPFVDLKLVQESIEFFKAQGDPHHRRGLETMATLYQEQGDQKNSITLNEALLSLDPNYSKNPNYDISIIESLNATDRSEQAVKRLFSRLPLYLEGSSWYEINSNDPKIVKNTNREFEETARKMALRIHSEGQKTKNERLYQIARTLYEKYLETFPRSPQSPQIRFYLAEILYKQEKYLSAADQYYLVYKDPSAGLMRHEAIRYTLSALDKEMNLERRKAGLAEISSKSTTKLKDAESARLSQIPYSEVELKFITISNEFLRAFPRSKEAPEVIYEQGYIQYVHYDFNSAYKSFWQVIQTYPQHETAYASAYLVLDVLNRRKEYSKLVLACQKLLSTPSFNRTDFKENVATVLRHSELKRIGQIEEKGSYKEAADAYANYSNTYGSQDEALFEKALYNAGVNYSKAEAFLQAAETQEKFLRRFPKSSYRENMLLQVAKTYETLANFEKAAFYYEAFSTSFSTHEQARPALRLAGIYYWGAGNPSKAESIMRGYITRYPKDSKAVGKDLLDLYGSQNAFDNQISYYLNDRSQKGIPLSQYLYDTVQIAEIQKKHSGKSQPKIMQEALTVAQKHRKELLQSPRGVESLAKVYFWYTNEKEEEFYRIKLALPQRQLEANLQRKLALLKELEKNYSQVASLGGGEWGIGAMVKTAQAYRQMATDVSNAPVPSNLSAEQLDLYRTEIQKQMVKPFNEKALALSQNCLDKAQEFNILSEWTSHCYSIASQLEKERYPTARTFYLPPIQVALFIPNREGSKTALGGFKNYLYPYYSSGLFGVTHRERTLASFSPIGLPTLNLPLKSSNDANVATPNLTSLRALSDERRLILGKTFDSERPTDLKKPTFAYLNLLRTQNPQKAVMMVLEAIQRDPTNSALHNLLGLSYLEAGNYSAARVTWLSLIARGIQQASLWNNLGVVSYLEGHEPQAIEYFKQALELDGYREAANNLGHIALKYRNGFEAKKQFEKALFLEKQDLTALIGLGVAKIQNRETEAAKNLLIETVKNFKTDPYAQLSLSYLLIDIESEPTIARKILVDYMQQQSLEGDIQFREALQATKYSRAVGGSIETLPDLQ